MPAARIHSIELVEQRARHPGAAHLRSDDHRGDAAHRHRAAVDVLAGRDHPQRTEEPARPVRAEADDVGRRAHVVQPVGALVAGHAEGLRADVEVLVEVVTLDEPDVERLALTA